VPYLPFCALSFSSDASGGKGGGLADASLEEPKVAREDRFDRMKSGVSYGVSAGEGRPLKARSPK
jgi:hypothetical protein